MKQPSFVLKLAFVIGSIFILISSALIINKIIFISKACSTEGTVIDMRMSKEHDNDTTFAPVVQFKLTDGENITFISPVGSSSPQYKIGDSVKVLYTPDNPGNAEINYFISILLFIKVIFFEYWLKFLLA